MRAATAIASLLIVGFFAVFTMNGTASAEMVVIEPDDFNIGDVLNNAFPGVTLSNQGGPAPTIISSDGFFPLYSLGNIATTGTRVFGRVQSPPPQAGGDKLWDEGTAGTALGALRADFEYPANSVSIDLICTDDDGVFLRVFDSSGNQLDEVIDSCDGRIPPGFITASITRPTADIAYALAGATAGDGAYLDNLRADLDLPSPSKSLILGPLVPDGMGGLEPITDVGEGPYVAIGVRDQYWAFAVSITGSSDNDGQVYADGIPSLYELSPFFEEFETEVGCPDDGACDGIGEQDCPVTVTPPPSRGQSGQTLIAIDPTDLEIGESCTTTVYVKLREGAISNIRSCPTAAFDDSSLNYTFPFNDGVQCFDADTHELVAGPFDPIRLMPVGCP